MLSSPLRVITAMSELRGAVADAACSCAAVGGVRYGPPAGRQHAVPMVRCTGKVIMTVRPESPALAATMPRSQLLHTLSCRCAPSRRARARATRGRAQASADAAAGLPAGGAGGEGGTPSEQRCTFLELALALGPGLDARGVGTLFRAALPGLQARRAAAAAVMPPGAAVMLGVTSGVRAQAAAMQCSWARPRGLLLQDQ